MLFLANQTKRNETNVNSSKKSTDSLAIIDQLLKAMCSASKCPEDCVERNVWNGDYEKRENHELAFYGAEMPRTDLECVG